MNTSFRTTLRPIPAPVNIGHKYRSLLLGSCFTEHIGQKLSDRKFQTLTNPFGIVYNPISIASCLERIADEDRLFIEEDLFENAGLWHSWEHHGRFSHPNKMDALKSINTAYQAAAEEIKKTDFLLLTFGTADVFELRASGQVVANNHKMPSVHFIQRRLTVTEIVEKTVKAIKRLPHAQVILTVSPVRHLRNGLIENQRAKAILLLACEEICRELENVHYFPAYELLLDDLRDYRFYAADMIHPSEVAVEYVWQYFSDTYFSESTRQLNERIEKIRTAAQHRPFHPNTEPHKAFVQAQLIAIEGLKKEMPGLDFGAEEAGFSRYLNA